MDDDARRNAGAVGMAAGSVEADVVNLWPEGKMREKREVHAAAEAPGELVAGTAGTAEREPRASDQGLRKRSQLAWVMQGKTRPEQVCVSVERDAAGRGVVAAKVADQAQPFVGEVGDGAAGPVLVDSTGASEAEV